MLCIIKKIKECQEKKDTWFLTQMVVGTQKEKKHKELQNILKLKKKLEKVTKDYN